MEKYQWIGLYKVFERVVFFGIGVGWGNKPRLPSLIIQLGFWCLIICKKYRNGIPENRENILELIMITAECLFGDIVFYKTRIDLEERKELIELEMEKKARKEITD